MELMFQLCHIKCINIQNFNITCHLKNIRGLSIWAMALSKHKFIHIPLEIKNIGIQLRLLVCNSAAYTDILLGHDAMLALGMWQDYPRE